MDTKNKLKYSNITRAKKRAGANNMATVSSEREREI
jgi:hypothetical protein